MKEIKMNSLQLQALFDTLKDSIARDDSRPVLKYIKVEINGEELTAVSVDGYTLSTFKTKIINEDKENFEFLIQPFYIPKTKLGCEVIFNCDTENLVRVVITDQITRNKIEYEFYNKCEVNNFIDWKKVLGEPDENLKIFVNANLLIKTLKQFTKNHALRNSEVEISFEREKDGIAKLHPINIKQHTKIGIEKEAIVLPIRNLED